MNLSAYPNLAKTIEQLGGVKQTLINKKKFAESEEAFAKIPQEFLMQINDEIPDGIKIFNNYLTSSALLIVELNTLTIVPTKDIAWIYPRVVTQKMNFIPMQKMHMIIVVTKDGNSYNLGMSNTGGFSKKDPLEEYFQSIHKLLDPSCPKIVYGWNDAMNSVFPQQ